MGSSKKTETTNQTTQGYGPALEQANRVLSTSGDLAQNTNIWHPTQSAGTVGGISGLNQVGMNGSGALGGLQNTFSGAAQGFGVGNGGLQASARGDNLSNRAPGFGEALDRASQDTADDVQRQFSGAGRYGSAADTRTLADRIGQMRNQAEVGQYNTERGYQNQAQGQLQQGGFQGANQAGNLQDAQTFGARTQLMAGGMQDQYDMQNRMAPVAANQYAQSVAYPGSQLGQTMKGTTTNEQRANPLTTGLGIGTTALGLMTGSPMMGMGGAGGLLGGGGGGSFAASGSLPWQQGYTARQGYSSGN